jgi:hypothetical protein
MVSLTPNPHDTDETATARGLWAYVEAWRFSRSMTGAVEEIDYTTVAIGRHPTSAQAVQLETQELCD